MIDKRQRHYKLYRKFLFKHFSERVPLQKLSNLASRLQNGGRDRNFSYRCNFKHWEKTWSQESSLQAGLEVTTGQDGDKECGSVLVKSDNHSNYQVDGLQNDLVCDNDMGTAKDNHNLQDSKVVKHIDENDSNLVKSASQDIEIHVKDCNLFKLDIQKDFCGCKSEFNDFNLVKCAQQKDYQLKDCNLVKLCIQKDSCGSELKETGESMCLSDYNLVKTYQQKDFVSHEKGVKGNTYDKKLTVSNASNVNVDRETGSSANFNTSVKGDNVLLVKRQTLSGFDDSKALIKDNVHILCLMTTSVKP